VYVDNTFSQLTFSSDAYIRDISGTLYINNLEVEGNFATETMNVSTFSVDDISANTAEINVLSIGTLKSLNDVSINILDNVSEIYFGVNTDVSYIQLGDVNTVVNVPNHLDASSGYFKYLKVDTFEFEYEDIDVSNINFESAYCNNLLYINPGAKLCIDSSANFEAEGDVSMNDVYVHGTATFNGSANFVNIDASSINTANLTTSGTVVFNNGTTVNNGITVNNSDLTFINGSIIQW
jgi:hypothetical protein